MMELKGEVLKRFADSQNDGKIYAPKGTYDIQEYTHKKIEYPHIFKAEQKRYEQLMKMGYVSEPEILNDKKMEIENEEQ